jgi:hypothetical protein
MKSRRAVNATARQPQMGPNSIRCVAMFQHMKPLMSTYVLHFEVFD